MTPSAFESDRTVLLTGGLTPRAVATLADERRPERPTAPGTAADHSRGPADWHTEVLAMTELRLPAPARPTA